MKSDDLIKMLKEDGWYHVGTRGSHNFFKHPVKKGKVTVPHPRKDLTKPLVQQIRKQAQL